MIVMYIYFLPSQGATLYFDTCSLISLPESLKKRSVIGIRVSDVDDEAKTSLM